MARPLRIEYEGALYHITSRGNALQKIFLADKDLILFLKTLEKVIDRYGWICHAYCLMGNHYHLLIETPSPSLSRGMQLLNGIYTQSFNRKHSRTGHVFQGRFKAILIEKESHLLAVARYIVLNPVRSKMVRAAKDWPWSNYRATVEQSGIPGFLEVDWTLSQFSDERSVAIERYRDFVRQGKGVDVWNDLRSGSLLGSDAFADRIRPLLQSALVDPHILRKEITAARPTLVDLFADKRDRDTRNKLIWEAVRIHNYTLQQVADLLGLHYSTISVIASKEDLRIQK